uniref:Uncharacterized protein n=1 Tax=Escherichia coli TaxID=562 RepID=I3W029_ECOLX|nr:hypothetical protein [Escherichia coli]
MIWQPEFTDKTLSRKTGAVQTEEVPDARQELLNRLLSGKKLTGRDEKDIRRLWQEKVDAMQASATRQREQDTLRTFIGEDGQ